MDNTGLNVFGAGRRFATVLRFINASGVYKADGGLFLGRSNGMCDWKGNYSLVSLDRHPEIA